MKIPTVALVGRPNVGKSTIFNKLIGKKVSIVEDTPGVTRDRIYGDVTYKNYKYGIYSSSGEEILPNEYDFIYMPDFKTLRIKYKNTWYEAEQISQKDALFIEDDKIKKVEEDTFKVTQLVKNTGFSAGYGVVTATDYTLKIFSSVSEAYEETIDELMLSKGVETINILAKFSWIPKFPIVFAQKYYSNIIEPDNSPLSEVRNEIKEQIK